MSSNGSIFLSSLASKFDGNQKLRKRGEELLLRLFSHESNDLKGYIQMKPVHSKQSNIINGIFHTQNRITYRLAAEKMAHFFSCLMDGSTFISKSYATNGSKNNILGLPLTIDILIEIICFGLGSTDPTVKEFVFGHSLHPELIFNNSRFVHHTDFFECRENYNAHFAQQNHHTALLGSGMRNIGASSGPFAMLRQAQICIG